MPKKLSTNPKAEAARERKEAKSREEKERAERAKEDAYWKDDHQDAARKQKRKDDKEQKRIAQLERKKEAKALLEQEESKLPGKSKQKAPSKVTRVHIEQQKLKDEQVQKAVDKEKKKEEDLSNSFAGENPNQMMADLLTNEGITEARNIEDAISVLKLKDNNPSPVDKHPEKRMKAAYAAFEEENLPKLKEENQNLRLSQLKQLLRKEWMKSPSNPMNQHS